MHCVVVSRQHAMHQASATQASNVAFNAFIELIACKIWQGSRRGELFWMKTFLKNIFINKAVTFEC